MPLRPFLHRIATEYDAQAGTGSELQAYLRTAQTALADVLPPGLLSEGHGGFGSATATPWLGILDPDVSSSPTRGLYLAYLFAADLSTVTLSLQQGTEDLSKNIGPAAARQQLAADAALLQAALPADQLAGLTEPFDLGYQGWRQRGYEAGSVAQLTYQTRTLPSEPDLAEHLHRFLALLADTAAVRRGLLVQHPGQLHGGGGQQDDSNEDPLAYFKPKNSSDYVAVLSASTQIKSRRHEALVEQYGRHAYTRGWLPSVKEHPLDLTLAPRPPESRPTLVRCLVEAKVLRRGNATVAVREAIGQLLTYRLHFVSDVDRAASPLVALFSEDIGDAYVDLLDCELGMAVVWYQREGWHGSDRARQLQLY